MRLLLALVLSLTFTLSFSRKAVKPIRCKVPIPDTNPSDTYRMERHDRTIRRAHKWQPPIIPHHIRGYQITKNVNTCMTCHSKKAAPRRRLRRSASRTLDREGKEHPNISTRRYFCLQCHVPQFDAEPLVGNTYTP